MTNIELMQPETQEITIGVNCYPKLTLVVTRINEIT